MPNMMNKYYIEKESEVYKIVEVDTDHIVEIAKNINAAKKFLNHFNSNVGFDGWTPYFFTVKIKQYINR